MDRGEESHSPMSHSPKDKKINISPNMLKSAGHVCYIKLFKPFNYLVLSTFSSFFYQGENHTSRGTDTERFR